MHDVALQRHQPERIAPGALYADAGFEVFRHHRAAKEVVDHAAVFPVKADQLRGHAQAARQFQNLALARVEHAGAHRADGQKCGAAEAVVAQVLDHALGVLVALDDDVLQSAAQHHVDGALQLFRHFDQLRHYAMHARRAALARVEQHLLDRMLVTLVVVLHLHEQFEARIGSLALAHDGVDALGELLALLRGNAHLLHGGGHFALEMRLAPAFLLDERPRRGELFVQRACARLGALAVLVHGGKLALQRRAQRFQARLLVAHVAQAVHRLDDLFLLRLGLLLEGGKFRLEFGELLLAGRLLRLQRGQFARFRFDPCLQFLDVAPDAAAALPRRVALGKQAVALALACEYALAHHLHGALAGLHFADPLLHDLALGRRLALEAVQLHKPFLAGGGNGLQFFLRLRNGL